MPIDHLMKVKTSDGYDILYPITKSDNVKTSEDIEVMLPANTKVGSYKNGDTIDENTPVSQILKKILQVQVPPVYTAPSISITATGGFNGKFEVGTTINTTVTSTFTKNDAGDIVTHQINKNGTQITSGTNASVSYSDSFVIGDSAVTYSSSCSYGAGAVKNDNFGDPYSTGVISAGTKTSSTLTCTPYRSYFYGADTIATAPADSDDVRAIANKSTAAAAANTSFTVNVAAGDKRVVIAYPATIRNISEVLYVEAGNDNYTFKFTNPDTISVEGANGATGINYKVYSWIPDQPFASAMTLKVKI